MFPYLIPIAVLSQITGTKVGRLRKMYEPILANDCIPLTEIPSLSRKPLLEIISCATVTLILTSCNAQGMTRIGHVAPQE